MPQASFLNSPPSVSSTAVSGARGGASSADNASKIGTGAFNFGGSSLSPLFIIGGAVFVLMTLIKRK